MTETAEMLRTYPGEFGFDADQLAEALDAMAACALTCTHCATCAEACRRCEARCRELLDAMG